MAEKSPLKIEVVADVVCPWCYLGWARLQKALELRPDVKPEIIWKAYQLRPETPAEGGDYKKMMAEKFDPERLKEMRVNMGEMAKELGIEFQFDKITKSPNTNAAHRLIRWAQKEGKLDAVARGVMKAYFTEGKFIADEKVLADIGAAAGMDKQAILKKFADGTDRDAVIAEHKASQDAGVSGVPFYLLGGSVKVEGSYPAEELAAEIDQALAA